MTPWTRFLMRISKYQEIRRKSCSKPVVLKSYHRLGLPVSTRVNNPTNTGLSSVHWQVWVIFIECPWEISRPDSDAQHPCLTNLWNRWIELLTLVHHTIYLSLFKCYKPWSQLSKALPLCMKRMKSQNQNILICIQLLRGHETLLNESLCESYIRSVIWCSKLDDHYLRKL